jgi:hypothetical protein
MGSVVEPRRQASLFPASYMYTSFCMKLAVYRNTYEVVQKWLDKVVERIV